MPDGLEAKSDTDCTVDRPSRQQDLKTTLNVPRGTKLGLYTNTLALASIHNNINTTASHTVLYTIYTNRPDRS